LSANGLLQDRISAEAGEPARVHVVEERVGFLTEEQREVLQAKAESCFLRRVELRAAGRSWVYAETLVPDHTLEIHAWLADLGERGLGETLSWRHDVERGPLEVAALPSDHPLAARAMQSAGLTAETLWARRAWHAIAGHRILVQEVFLPEPRRR
jgi:chorismate-pyruvate lyase